jgi:Spy/CpxP family protein refolding chaperone
MANVKVNRSSCLPEDSEEGDGRMRKFSVMMVGLVAISLWSTVVYGLPHGNMRGMGPRLTMGDGTGMLIPLVLKGVDLTPEQETRVQEIMAAHRATLQTLSQQMRQVHEELATRLFTPGEVQTADLTPHTQRIAQLREQLMQAGLAAALEVRAVLTPEQLAKAAELKERMQTLRSEMRSLFRGKP